MSDRVRGAFEALIERMEDPPTWEEVSVPAARPQQLRRTRRPVLVAASALVAVIILGVLIVTMRPVTYQLPTVDVAAGEVIVSVDPLVVLGTPAPEPRFDTSTLGVEVELRDANDISGFLSWASQAELFPDGELSKVIVAGRIDTGANAGMAVVSQRETGDVEWCILITTQSGFACSTVPDFQTPTFIIRFGEPLTGTPGTLSWGPAPEGTSVVTLEFGDTRLWQQPVSGIVLFPLDISPAELVITALDEDGNQIHTDTGRGGSD